VTAGRGDTLRGRAVTGRRQAVTGTSGGVITRFERGAGYAILTLFAVVAVYPVLLIAATALEPERPGEGGWPRFGNLAEAWVQGHFGSYMRTSAIVAVLVVGMAAVFSILAGYAFGTMRFRGSETVFYLVLLGMMIPTEALVVALYFDLRSVGLTNTLVAIVMPQVAQSVAFGTFWMRAYFRSSAREVVEAARLDGATHWQILWRVLVPIGRPAIATMTVLIFVWTWNEFMIPLVMATDENLRTAPLGLAFFQGQYTSGTALLAAGAVLVALPVVAVYLFLQRHVIRGTIEGAVR
jgi:raffinose/stachyose/melibiose transport system permease protein